MVFRVLRPWPRMLNKRSLRLRKEVKMNKMQIALNGILKSNPVFVLVLGMCPTLGTTTSASNGMGMGLATMAVLVMSNFVISIIKNLIPDKVRIPAFIVVIASFVTIIQMLMEAFVPALYASLGVFIPLIVVNCIILGRAEAFASKNGILASALDGLFQGIGYTAALVVMCVIRELLGSGTFGGGILRGGEGIRILPEGTPAMLMIMPVGGFLTLGFLIAGAQWLMKRLNQKKEAAK